MINTVIKTTALALGTPLTITAAYLLYLNHNVSPHITATTKLRRTPSDKSLSGIPKPKCIPPDVADENSPYILAYERVTSHPLSLSKFHPNADTASPSSLLTRYIRATMTAFSYTPQVYLLKRMMSKDDFATLNTFNRERIASLEFDVGDRVHGVWRVAYRGDLHSQEGKGEGHRVELAMEAPPGYNGPVVQGVVVVGVERVDGEHVVFVNETWMWRRKGEKKVMLEGAAGRWFHVLLSGWLVKRGVEEVMGGGEARGEEKGKGKGEEKEKGV
ncbi:hypothetical protein QBC34DRAFT_443118 [Podospora aff. communis PSN243]|uniref:Uncharacterized protein n=1 Tax=Podospora aff. communis PSN243 TaxID=3040156 RepID=A0AAV9G5N8_9PEZI|nr:hypothetical protein QBC34DRAFT_443118 [Podospora aff. communis PSN243]